MKEVVITCERCGLEFKVDESRWRTRYCQECKLDINRERVRAKCKKRKQKKAMKKSNGVKLPLEKVIALQEEHNRTNGTLYTYGQFVLMLENGEIEIEE